jgi:hypothetical protein
MAAMLFPVFASAKSAALKTSCLSHFGNVGKAYTLYASDYDDMAVIVNECPGQTPNSRTDRTWVQLLLPYAPSFSIFHCPADATDDQGLQASFDQDLVPGDLYSEYYTASLRSDVGYNFQYLAPIVSVDGIWEADPTDLSTIVRPGDMMMFADSAWQVTNGVPSGGGSWLISPPCRYAAATGGQEVDTITPPAAFGGITRTSKVLFAPSVGWGDTQDAENQYGGVWTRHQGEANIVRIDGSAKALTMDQIASGCNVQPDWTGKIYDRGAYIWSPR